MATLDALTESPANVQEPARVERVEPKPRESALRGKHIALAVSSVIVGTVGAILAVLSARVPKHDAWIEELYEPAVRRTVNDSNLREHLTSQDIRASVTERVREATLKAHEALSNTPLTRRLWLRVRQNHWPWTYVDRTIDAHLRESMAKELRKTGGS